MDIRSFFGKKPGTGGGGDKKVPTPKIENVTNPSSTSKKRVNNDTTATSSLESIHNNNQNKKRKETSNDIQEVKVESKASPPIQKKETNNKSALNKRSQKKTIIDDASTTDDEYREVIESPIAKKLKKNIETYDDSTTTDDEYVSKSKPTSKINQQKMSTPKKKSNIWDDSEEDEKGDYDNNDNNADDNEEDNTNNTPEKSHKETTTTPTKKRKPTTNQQPTTPSSKKQATRTTKSPTTKKQQTKPQKIIVPKPTYTLSSYPTTQAKPLCLESFTFVVSGKLTSLSREDAIEYIKILGGRVTTAVSSKTNYLVIGDELEDGRNVQEGNKYKKAMELKDKVVILHGEEELFALASLLSEGRDGGDSSNQDEEVMDDGINSNQEGHIITTDSKLVKLQEDSITKISSSEISIDTKQNNTITTSSTTAAVAVANPYSKKVISNPYAKKNTTTTSSSSNPYLKPNPYKDKKPVITNNHPSATIIGGGRADITDTNALWADKYAPSSVKEIIGNPDCVKKLTVWLERWEETFNNPRSGKISLGNPKGPFKAALLSGPPGIGKTTTAVLVAKENNRQIIELNASDTRSKSSLTSSLKDVTGSQVLSFGKNGSNKSAPSQKRCVIMDEVDGMGAGDRSGISELIHMIKESKVPIICICNDRQSQKLKSLVSYCLDLRCKRPIKTVIAKRAVQICASENMDIEVNAAEALAESCGNDIRQVLNSLQMWSNKKHQSSSSKAQMTYQELKSREFSISKDEILRVSMFDATKMIVQGRLGINSSDPKAEKDHFYNRTNAFFVDYSFMGLNVHQNYLKVMVSPFQRSKAQNDSQAELECLERMSAATHCMSDFGLAEETVRGGNQNWGLLPFCSVLAVKCGYHAGGEAGSFLPGYPEFAGWLGKNSSRGRMARILQELGHHINYKISADSSELRLRYIPVIRDFLLNLLSQDSGTTEAINFMDEYGLDRDDVFEKLDEFTMNKKTRKFSDLDSKSKARFTREYNEGVHKSQALVDEQGITKTRKKKKEDRDENASEDVNGTESESEEEEISEEQLKKLFKAKKGGRKSSSKKK